jgi:hypothetical protein
MHVWTTRILSTLLAILICCTPELAGALAGQDSARQDGQSTATQPQQTNNGSSAAEPAREPALPDAPSQTQPNPPAASTSAPQNNATDAQQPTPEGTAAARVGKVSGGPASKPAGSAIAPAKQRQTRSILIKLGIIAGAGAALGTVYALSRSAPSHPPGTR